MCVCGKTCSSAVGNGWDVWEGRTRFSEAMLEAPSVLLAPVLLTLISCQSFPSPFCLANPSGSSNTPHLPVSLSGFREKTEGEAQ